MLLGAQQYLGTYLELAGGTKVHKVRRARCKKAVRGSLRELESPHHYRLENPSHHTNISVFSFHIPNPFKSRELTRSRSRKPKPKPHEDT